MEQIHKAKIPSKALGVLLSALLIMTALPTQALALPEEGLKSPSFQSLEGIYALTVPDTADARVFKYINAYNQEVLTPSEVIDNPGDTTTYHYPISNASSDYTYRIAMEGKVTRAGFLSSAAMEKTVTFEDSEDPKSVTTTAGVPSDDNSTLVNINSDNVLKLSIGDEFCLRGFHAWQIVNDTINNRIIEPDFTFRILSGETVIALDPHESFSDRATVTALSQGSAVVEVSYDAIEVEGGLYPGRYGATDPARKAVFVVTVNTDSSNVGFNIVKPYGLDEPWDSEFDTWYFTSESATATITTDSPAASFSVYNPDIPDTEHTPVWNEQIGMISLYPGSNIIACEDGYGISYKVVRAYRTTPIITNITNPGEDPKSGDTISIHLDSIHLPVPKMGGLYNPGFGVELAMELAYASSGGMRLYSNETQYDFSDAHTITLTIPDEDADYYLGFGRINGGTMGKAPGTHRNVNEAGIAAEPSSLSSSARYGVFPDIHLQDAAIASYDGKLITITPRISTDKVIDLPGGTTSSGVQLQIYTANHTFAQSYRVVAQKDIDNAYTGYFSLINLKSGKALEVMGNVAGNEIAIHQNDQNGGNAQLFKLRQSDEEGVLLPFIKA